MAFNSLKLACSFTLKLITKTVESSERGFYWSSHSVKPTKAEAFFVASQSIFISVF